MSETSNLTELSKKLEQSKEKELQDVKRIESEKLHELSQSLRKSLENELSTLEADMVERHTNLKKHLSKIRKQTYNEQKQGLKQIEDEALNLVQMLNQIRFRYWIVPLIVGLSLTIGLSAGLWVLGILISDRNQVLNQLNERIKNGKEMKEALGGHEMIVKNYKNGMELKRKPQVWQADTGMWIVQFGE